jgi:hypothetical protein
MLLLANENIPLKSINIYFIDLLKIPELDWKGKFTTINRGRIRQRPLP